MGLNVVRNDVGQFQRKIQAMIGNDLLNLFTQRLIEEASRKAAELYGATHSVHLSYSVNGNIAYIAAEGKQVAYIEYGTGYRGEGSYGGETPDQPITFTSFGQEITIDKWTYYYAYKLNMTPTAWVGMPAQAQMWKTEQYIIENAQRILNEVFDEYVKSIK